ncbi:glycosyltransferase family 87 protein [Bradyrhizobium sp. B097]|uniref:glycosyltransferase family 87 protein n=1 Tax=Bradyrhizobium sp. B097 TaxID=3140244 RepID=UPI003182DA4C
MSPTAWYEHLLRYPSLKAPFHLLFLVCCVGLIADVLVPEIWGHGKTKDYPLWFWAGQQVLHGHGLYPADASGYFEFIYPPLPAVLLAIPAFFGKIPLYLCLSLLNAAAWWMVAQFSHAMAGSGREPGPWLEALPGCVMVTFVIDIFDLGQPNLILLAMMLYGFWLLRSGRSWLAGGMFALAVAIKVFPIAVLPYLVWRRRWGAIAGMTAFLVFFLFVLPAPFRGFQHNVDELKTWYHGMVGTSSAEGFGQRAEQNWSSVNQSIIAVSHRLLRPLNYNQDDPSKPPRYMNLLDLDFATANWVIIAVTVLIGLGYIWVMPPAWLRTEKSDAEEIGILFCLMTVASPLAREYYFMWLFFPITVLMHRAVYHPRPKVRTGTWVVLAVACALLGLSLPWYPIALQAYGNNLAATFVLIGGLVWHIRKSSAKESGEALPPAAGAVQLGAMSNQWDISDVQRQAAARPRPHRRRFRQQSRAAVHAAADQIDLG